MRSEGKFRAQSWSPGKFRLLTNRLRRPQVMGASEWERWQGGCPGRPLASVVFGFRAGVRTVLWR